MPAALFGLVESNHNQEEAKVGNYVQLHNQRVG